MIALRRMFESRSLPATAERLIPSRSSGGGMLAAPAAVPDDATALRHEAVWACVDLLVDQLATFPVDEIVRKVEVSSSALTLSPSAQMTQIEWRTAAWVSLLLRGNAFGLVTEWDRSGWPAKVEPIHPDAVGWDEKSGRYRLGDGTLHSRFPVGDLWHVRGLVVPGYRFGLSPVMAAAAAIELGLSATGFGRRWFRDGAHPTAIVKASTDIGEVQAQAIKDRILDALHGSREPLVLSSALDYQPIQISPEESQFLDTLGANASTVARVFRVPPELIGAVVSGSSVTYANVEHRGIQFLTYSLLGRLIRFEEAWSSLLPDRRSVRHNVDALLRVDALTRARVMDAELRSGLLGRNEGRQLLDRPPATADDPDFVWPPAGVKSDIGDKS